MVKRTCCYVIVGLFYIATRGVWAGTHIYSNGKFEKKDGSSYQVKIVDRSDRAHERELHREQKKQNDRAIRNEIDNLNLALMQASQRLDEELDRYHNLEAGLKYQLNYQLLKVIFERKKAQVQTETSSLLPWPNGQFNFNGNFLSSPQDRLNRKRDLYESIRQENIKAFTIREITGMVQMLYALEQQTAELKQNLEISGIDLERYEKLVERARQKQIRFSYNHDETQSNRLALKIDKKPVTVNEPSLSQTAPKESDVQRIYEQYQNIVQEAYVYNKLNKPPTSYKKPLVLIGIGATLPLWIAPAAVVAVAGGAIFFVGVAGAIVIYVPTTFVGGIYANFKRTKEEQQNYRDKLKTHHEEYCNWVNSDSFIVPENLSPEDKDIYIRAFQRFCQPKYGKRLRHGCKENFNRGPRYLMRDFRETASHNATSDLKEFHLDQHLQRLYSACRDVMTSEHSLKVKRKALGAFTYAIFEIWNDHTWVDHVGLEPDSILNDIEHQEERKRLHREAKKQEKQTKRAARSEKKRLKAEFKRRYREFRAEIKRLNQETTDDAGEELSHLLSMLLNSSGVFVRSDLASLIKNSHDENFEAFWQSLKDEYLPKVKEAMAQNADYRQSLAYQRQNRATLKKEARAIKHKPLKELDPDEALILAAYKKLHQYREQILLMMAETINVSPHYVDSKYSFLTDKMSENRLNDFLSNATYDAFVDALKSSYGENISRILEEYKTRKRKTACLKANSRELKERVKYAKRKKKKNRDDDDILLTLFRHSLLRPHQFAYETKNIFNNDKLYELLKNHDCFEELLEDLRTRYAENVSAYQIDQEQQIQIEALKAGLSNKRIGEFRDQEFAHFDTALARIDENSNIAKARPKKAREKSSRQQKKEKKAAFSRYFSEQDKYATIIREKGSNEDQATTSDSNMTSPVKEMTITRKQALIHFGDWYKPLPDKISTNITLVDQCLLCCSDEKLDYTLFLSSHKHRGLTPGTLIQQPTKTGHKFSVCGHFICKECAIAHEAYSKHRAATVTSDQQMFSDFNCPMCRTDLPCEEMNEKQFKKAFGFPMHLEPQQ